MAWRLLRFVGLGCFVGGLMAVVGGCTMTQSAAQRAHQRKVVLDYEVRQLVEDVDMVLLLERPSRLTRWHVR